MSRVVIFVNGILPDPQAAKKLIHPDDFLIGVDGGARLITNLGLLPSLVVGDLDSLTETDLSNLKSAFVPIVQYPVDKDETDLEIGIRHARELEPASVLILAALGGRVDQTLANISLLTDPSLAALDIRLDDGVEELFFCRDEVRIEGSPGDTISLIPWHGQVDGVTTQNLQWKLEKETLFPHKTRGISNVMTAETAAVKIQSGLLLVIHHRYFAVD